MLATERANHARAVSKLAESRDKLREDPSSKTLVACQIEGDNTLVPKYARVLGMGDLNATDIAQ